MTNTSTTPLLSLEERHRTVGPYSERRSRKSARPRSPVPRFGDPVQASSFAIRRAPPTGPAVRIFYACVRITTAHTPGKTFRGTWHSAVAARQPITSVDAAGEIAIPVLLPQSPRRTGAGTGASGTSARDRRQGVTGDVRLEQGVRGGDSDGVVDPGL
ncbi:hypothetical protein DL769_004017 [Monosporascus sp. CRB-8-3]|nr:hypothetical protein DL769_004017 [Monosporascus sp. CRB-8-3]